MAHRLIFVFVHITYSTCLIFLISKTKSWYFGLYFTHWNSKSTLGQHKSIHLCTFFIRISRTELISLICALFSLVVNTANCIGIIQFWSLNIPVWKCSKPEWHLKLLIASRIVFSWSMFKMDFSFGCIVAWEMTSRIFSYNLCNN